MSTFYHPISLKYQGIPVIVYPMLGLEKIIQRGLKDIDNHLQMVYRHKGLQTGSYHILILWTDGTTIMTDVWEFLELESEETGFTVGVVTFKGIEEIKEEGITASDGLIMLGAECQLEESMRKQKKSLEEYIEGKRPELPMSLSLNQDF